MSHVPRLTRRGVLAGGIAAFAAPALAQTAWPAARPIEVIVGFAPGGGTDVMVRALTQLLVAELPGANFVVVNRPGAGGETAYVALQGARPDGYTIGTINTPGYVSLGVERRVRYDRARIRLIARLVDDPSAFVVHRDAPWRTLADLVEAAKRRPGTISVGSSGVGTDDHLGLTLFQADAGRHRAGDREARMGGEGAATRIADGVSAGRGLGSGDAGPGGAIPAHLGSDALAVTGVAALSALGHGSGRRPALTIRIMMTRMSTRMGPKIQNQNQNMRAAVRRSHPRVTR